MEWGPVHCELRRVDVRICLPPTGAGYRSTLTLYRYLVPRKTNNENKKEAYINSIRGEAFCTARRCRVPLTPGYGNSFAASKPWSSVHFPRLWVYQAERGAFFCVKFQSIKPNFSSRRLFLPLTCYVADSCRKGFPGQTSVCVQARTNRFQGLHDREGENNILVLRADSCVMGGMISPTRTTLYIGANT